MAARTLAITLVDAAPVPRSAPAGQPPAITIDDLPAHGPLPPGRTRAGVIRAIAAALRDAGAPAHGFFNAGLPLGNYGYDHRNLDQVGAAAFLADVDRNEAPLAVAAPPGTTGTGSAIRSSPRVRIPPRATRSAPGCAGAATGSRRSA